MQEDTAKWVQEYKAKFLKNSQRHDKKTFFLRTFKNNFKKMVDKAEDEW